MSIRLSSDRNHELARTLWDMDEVVGLDRDGDDRFIVRVRNSCRFFEKVSDLVLEENFDIQHMEPLDESTHDVLGYLLGGC